jgi:hypothetical protein
MGKILGEIKILGLKEISDFNTQDNYKMETEPETEPEPEPEPAGEVNLRKVFKWMRNTSHA